MKTLLVLLAGCPSCCSSPGPLSSRRKAQREREVDRTESVTADRQETRPYQHGAAPGAGLFVDKLCCPRAVQPGQGHHAGRHGTEVTGKALIEQATDMGKSIAVLPFVDMSPDKDWNTCPTALPRTAEPAGQDSGAESRFTHGSTFKFKVRKSTWWTLPQRVAACWKAARKAGVTHYRAIDQGR
jgi:hypothetical protein